MGGRWEWGCGEIWKGKNRPGVSHWISFSAGDVELIWDLSGPTLGSLQGRGEAAPEAHGKCPGREAMRLEMVLGRVCPAQDAK